MDYDELGRSAASEHLTAYDLDKFMRLLKRVVTNVSPSDDQLSSTAWLVLDSRPPGGERLFAI